MKENPEKPIFEWLHNDHWHCIKCGTRMRFMIRLAWEARCGVRALGICPFCKIVLIEKEIGNPIWSESLEGDLSK